MVRIAVTEKSAGVNYPLAKDPWASWSNLLRISTLTGLGILPRIAKFGYRLSNQLLSILLGEVLHGTPPTIERGVGGDPRSQEAQH
jgi:hypothetical protein